MTAAKLLAPKINQNHEIIPGYVEEKLILANMKKIAKTETKSVNKMIIASSQWHQIQPNQQSTINRILIKQKEIKK